MLVDLPICILYDADLVICFNKGASIYSTLSSIGLVMVI